MNENQDADCSVLMGDDEDSSSDIDRARMSIDSDKILAKVKREEQFIGKNEV